jgi:hypothetical protein
VDRQDAKDAKDARELQGPEGETDQVASAVLQAAIEVHRGLGPGFLETVYEQALDVELTLRRTRFVRQPAIAVVYKDRSLTLPISDPGVLAFLAFLAPIFPSPTT